MIFGGPDTKINVDGEFVGASAPRNSLIDYLWLLEK